MKTREKLTDLARRIDVVETRGMSKTPPTVYRRIIAATLRQLRGDRPRAEIEQACKLGDNALYRYESCESSMSELVARTVFEYLGVEGADLERLLQIARMSRRRGKAPAVNSVPSWFEQLLVLEQDASTIEEVALTIIPGLLQTEQYARAIVAVGSAAHMDDYVTARMERQQILDGDVQFWPILHEAALRRVVGGAEVMREQIQHLIEVAQRKNVKPRVIPNSAGAHRSMLTSFMLLQFRLAPNYKLAYTEHPVGALYVDDPPEVAKFEDAYRHVTAVALSKNHSIELLEQIVKDYK